MGDREAAEGKLGIKRLHVAQDGLAGGRIAHVSNRRGAAQGADHRLGAELLADLPEAAVGMEVGAVEGDDSGRLLTPVLQRVQAQDGMRGGVLVTKNAEYAARLAQLVVIERVRVHGHGLGRPSPHRSPLPMFRSSSSTPSRTPFW